MPYSGGYLVVVQLADGLHQREEVHPPASVQDRLEKSGEQTQDVNPGNSGRSEGSGALQREGGGLLTLSLSCTVIVGLGLGLGVAAAGAGASISEGS